MGAERCTHGGDRLSIDFTEEQVVSLAAKLAELTGKSVKTMKNWLTFTELLSVEALKTLVAWNCTRSVYEAIQPARRAFIRGLQGRGLTEGETIEAVSQKVLELAERHLEETREREARPRTRSAASNGRTHQADGPARANGNGTDSTYVESREDSAAQQAEGTEQERSPQEEQSDKKGATRGVIESARRQAGGGGWQAHEGLGGGAARLGRDRSQGEAARPPV